MPNPQVVVLEAIARGTLYLAFLPVVGACAFRWFLLPRADPGIVTTRTFEALEQSVVRVGLIAAALLLLAVLLRAWAHTAAAFGAAEALSWESLRVVTVESRWGAQWRPQLLASAGVMLAFGWARIHPASGWVLATAAVFGFCTLLPFLGHAAAHGDNPTLTISAQALHAAGAGVWLGTLLVIGIVAVPRPRKTPSPREANAIALAVIRAFPPVALTGAGLIVASGALLSFLYLHDLSDLWSSLYGGVLSTKVGLFAAVVGSGYYNWRRHRGAGQLPTVRDQRTIARRTIIVEIGFAMAILALTSLLTELPQPSHH